MRGMAYSSNDSVINTPTEFLDNITDFLTDPPEAMGTTAVNTYLSAKAQALQLTRRYTGLPYFDNVDDYSSEWASGNAFPILSGVQKQTAVATLVNAASASLRSGSIYDFLNLLVSKMQYEFGVFTAPTYLEDSERGR